jgi:hypothetical protein
MTPLHLAGALILLAAAVMLIVEDEHYRRRWPNRPGVGRGAWGRRTMNAIAILDELYLERAEARAEVEAAQVDYNSCRVNTPGRCSQESARLVEARDWLARVERDIRRFEARAETA